MANTLISIDEMIADIKSIAHECAAEFRISERDEDFTAEAVCAEIGIPMQAGGTEPSIGN